MSNIKTLAANMRQAFFNRKSATIGSGIFTPEELKDGAIALNAYPDLLAALERFAKAVTQGNYPELQGIATDAFVALDKTNGVK
jgi:hypothetical protein